MSSQRSDLLAEIALKSAPRLAKCEPSESRRQQCEERAAAAYRSAIAAMPGSTWSVRKFASAIERSPRMHLDYSSGARSIPVDVVLLLPNPARVRFLSHIGHGLTRDERLDLARALLDDLPESDDTETARCA